MPQLDLDARRRTFREVNLGFTSEAAVAEAQRCILCENARCVLVGCPLRNRIPEWMELIQDGAFMEAAALTRATSSMPEICSRICPQDRLCESVCAIGIKHEPVAIGALERFVNDWARAHGDIPLEPGEPTGRTVAIVGAGPAGLAVAEQMRQMGHQATVFDAMDSPGGLLAHGIPGFKLNPEVVRARWRLLEEAGVLFEGRCRVGVKVTLDALFRDGFDAIFLGLGAWTPVAPRLPGLEMSGVVHALEFLRGGADGVPVAGKAVVVLGGGDTAMDCARTAVRRGAARAVVAYRRDEANMPGSRKEVKAAREEGVEFEFLVSPLAFLDGEGGRLRAIRMQGMELGEPDAQGRRSPRPVPGSEAELPADLAVLAFGFRPDARVMTEGLGLEVTREGTILVNPETGATSRGGVFAGGDCTLGADLVCRAVAAGRRAAQGIHRFLTEGDWAAVAPKPQA